MKKLTQLHVFSTKGTKEAVVALKKERPTLDVVR